MKSINVISALHKFDLEWLWRGNSVVSDFRDILVNLRNLEDISQNRNFPKFFPYIRPADIPQQSVED